MNPKTFLLAVLTVLFTCSIVAAQAPPDQEEITLSTYYPAPYGEYDELCAEKLLIWSPISTELANMGLGDCHIGYSLIVGKGGTGFSYGQIGSGELRDGEVLIKGYLGIGTTNPGQKLHIQDSDDNDFVMRVDKAAIGRASLIEFQNSTIDNLFGYIGLLGTTGGIMVQGSDASGTDPLFRIQTNEGVERFRVTADGNVGIGTTGPLAPLQIARSGGYYWGDGNGRGWLTIGSGGTYGLSFGIAEGGSGAGDARIWTDGGTGKLIISGGSASRDVLTIYNGNVGIGTTSPTATLDVDGTVSIFGSWTNLDSNGNTLVKDAVYQAPTDGFVCAVEQSNGDNWIAGFTDANNPPTTYILKNCNYTNRTGVSISFPVVKEQYWRVSVRVGTAEIRWLPIGNGVCERQ